MPDDGLDHEEIRWLTSGSRPLPKKLRGKALQAGGFLAIGFIILIASFLGGLILSLIDPITTLIMIIIGIPLFLWGVIQFSKVSKAEKKMRENIQRKLSEKLSKE